MQIPPVEREKQLEPCISANIATIATSAQVAFSEAFVLSEETKQKRRHALRPFEIEQPAVYVKLSRFLIRVQITIMLIRLESQGLAPVPRFARW